MIKKKKIRKIRKRRKRIRKKIKKKIKKMEKRYIEKSIIISKNYGYILEIQQ